MKKITFCIFLMFVGVMSYAQSIDEPANWPNADWTITGSYSTDDFIENPTDGSSLFSFDDNAAGSSSTDNIAAESPIIDITSAQTAGETLYFTGQYVYRDYSIDDEFLVVQYWNEDSSEWINWIDPITVTTPGAPTSNFCTATPVEIISDGLNVSEFTATQLSNFKYRILFDDQGGWGYGFCVSNPSLYSSSCPYPSDAFAENATTTTIDLAWTENGTATSWSIEYGAEGFTPGTGTTVTATSNPFTLTDLDSATDYEYYVTSVCSETSSSLATGPYSFTTECSPFSTPFTEGFENGGEIPNCWAQTDDDDETEFADWEFSNSNFYTEINGNTETNGFFAYIDDSFLFEDQFATITSPQVYLAGLTTPSVQFYLTSDDYGYENATLTVDYFDGAEWHDAIYTSNTNTDGWQFVAIDLSAYPIAGLSRVRFVVEGSSSYYDDLAIDDVTFDEMPACATPSEMSIANISTEGADISWVENGFAEAWNIEYGLTGFTQGTEFGTIVTVYTNPATVEGLTPGTEYDVYLQANCSSEDSNWIGPLTFTTLCEAFGDFTEGFEEAAPGTMADCWTGINETDSNYSYVEANAYTTYEGSRCMVLSSSSATSGDLMLVTPMLEDLPNGTHRARFMLYGSGSVEVGTLSDIADPSSFTVVETFTASFTYTMITVDFDEPTTDSFVALRHGLTNTYQTFRIDNFQWLAMPTEVPSCVTNVVATPDESCGNFANSISWDAVGSADGYYLTIGTTEGGNDIVDNEDVGFETEYIFEGTANTTYYYTISPYNSIGTTEGCDEYSFMTNADSCYCESVPTSNDNQGITNVTIMDTDIPNGDVTYADYTDTVIDIYQGLTTTGAIDFATGFTYNTNIWIDFNDNYTFESSELVYSGESLYNNPTTLDISFLIPATATLGEHRLRIGTADFGQATPNPCFSGSYGVTIDLTVNIIEPTCTLPTVDSTTVSPDCENDQYYVDVEISAFEGGNPSITDGENTWEVTATGTTQVGPFANSDIVSLTLLHGEDAVCDVELGDFMTACPPACPTNVTATPDENCGTFATLIDWDAVEFADGYYLTVGSAPGANNVLDNEDITATSYNLVAPAGTTFYYTVTAYNDYGTSEDCDEFTFSTSPNQCYCESVPTSNDNDGITNVTIGATDFVNGDVTYFDYTDTTVDLYNQGINNLLIDFATGYTYDVNIWIDFNDDYIYDSSEQVFDGVSLSTNPTTLDASFSLEGIATLALGTHNMRIGTADSGQATPNPCYSGSWGVTLDFSVNVVDDVAAVDAFDGFDFKYYPNPVNQNKLTLASQEEISDVVVFNLLGQEVLRLAPNASEYTVNMSQLSAGAYFVKVTIAEKTKTVKIIKE